MYQARHFEDIPLEGKTVEEKRAIVKQYKFHIVLLQDEHESCNGHFRDLGAIKPHGDGSYLFKPAPLPKPKILYYSELLGLSVSSGIGSQQKEMF